MLATPTVPTLSRPTRPLLLLLAAFSVLAPGSSFADETGHEGSHQSQIADSPQLDPERWIKGTRSVASDVGEGSSALLRLSWRLLLAEDLFQSGRADEAIELQLATFSAGALDELYLDRAESGETETESSTSTPEARPELRAEREARCAPIEHGEIRGIWIWGEDLLATPSGRSAFRRFARQKRINVVFIEAYKLIREDRLTLAAISASLAEDCIGLELLFGDPVWALPPNHRTVIGAVRSAVEFSSTLPAARPVGIHIDVEPHILSEWDDDLQGTANGYIDLLESISKELSGTDLRFSVDTGMFYDDRDILRRHTTRPLSAWVTDLVDLYVIMNYRDTVEELIDKADDELRYANSVGTDVLIGVLTNRRELGKITFFEEGEAVMNLVVSDMLEALSVHPSFSGYAVHDYRAFISLRP